MTADSRRKACIIDGNSYIHRAYHAIRGLKNSRGMPTNAVYGFLNMIIKVLKEERHDLMVVVFDAKGPTFRHELYPEYKANRPQMPKELLVQVEYIKKLTAAMGITILEQEGCEADDILAVLGRRAVKEGMEVLYITGDKDIQQLIDDHVSILDTMKDKRITIESFKKDRGYEPAQLVEVMALAGDPSDNIPGVPGIGLKTAEKLIREFGTVEDVYRRLDEIPAGKVKETLMANRDKANISRLLVVLRDDLDIDIDWKDAALVSPDKKALKKMFEDLEFKKFLRELDLGDEEAPLEFDLIEKPDEIDKWLKELDRSKPVSIAVSAGGADAFGNINLAMTQNGKMVAVNRLSLIKKDGAKGRVPEGIIEILEDPAVPKWGFDFKNSLKLFSRAGIALGGLDIDTMIAAYLIDPSEKGSLLSDLAMKYLGMSALFKDDDHSARQSNLFADEEIERQRAAKEAAVIHRLGLQLGDELQKSGMSKLYADIELPLIIVLYDMEAAGIAVDLEFLRDMSKEMDIILQRIQEEIFSLAGCSFNIGSPKQLAEILFDKFNLPVIKKTKTGFSTDEEVLTTLAAQHQIPSLIISYRQLLKLKNTYVDVLPQLVSPDDGRVHTTFNQAVTATGRLSSSNPNLQNIPVRSEWGRRIRRAFVPEKGCKFISADYSQIELRVLAHLSEDETLVEAFRKGEDIHTRTAMAIFRVSPDKVTREMRRSAKVINFGIIYGMSPYGLSKELGVDQREAKKYIEDYFSVYKGVRNYLDMLIDRAKKEGFVSTLFGRRRYLKELQSDKSYVVQFAERAALNTPIQGTAADLIKMAMKTVHLRLAKECRKARLLVQIHDELLLEAPLGEVEKTSAIVKECMEEAASFIVPIVVDLSIGDNWADLK